VSEKIPSELEVVPVLVPLMMMEALGMGDPVASVTLPLMVLVCPSNSMAGHTTASSSNSIFLMCVLV
jgi:hypothetical protein